MAILPNAMPTAMMKLDSIMLPTGSRVVFPVPETIVCQ